MDTGTIPGTNLGQLLHEKMEWFEKQLSFYGETNSNHYRPTPAQRKVLSLIQAQPSRLSDLARRIEIKRQSVHKTVNELVNAGIVDVIPDPTNKTAKLVRVSKKGTKKLKGLMERVSHIEEGIAENIGNDKVQLLFEILGSQWDGKIFSKIGEKKAFVPVLLSKPIYEILCKLNKEIGESISEILNNAVLSFCKPKINNRTDEMRIEKEWNQFRAQLENVRKMHLDEGVAIKPQTLFKTDGPIKADAFLFNNERCYCDILEHSSDVIYRVNLSLGKFEYVSPSSKKEWNMSPERMLHLSVQDVFSSIVHPADRERLSNHFRDSVLNGQEAIDSIIEYRAKVGKGGSYRWVSQRTTVVFNKKNKAVAIVGNARDITERKKAEIKLLGLVDRLERKVKEYSVNLEEKNAALKVLLKQNHDEKTQMEERILLNIKGLILPVVEKMRHSRLKNLQKHIDILESNLNRITSSFSSKLTSKSLNLSHQEFQVANYVMHGKTTKEIAELMGLSNRTIDFHRANIRKKVGLVNRKESLRSHLLSLQ